MENRDCAYLSSNYPKSLKGIYPSGVNLYQKFEIFDGRSKYRRTAQDTAGQPEESNRSVSIDISNEAEE